MSEEAKKKSEKVNEHEPRLSLVCYWSSGGEAGWLLAPAQGSRVGERSREAGVELDVERNLTPPVTLAISEILGVVKFYNTTPIFRLSVFINSILYCSAALTD